MGGRRGGRGRADHVPKVFEALFAKILGKYLNVGPI